ncbi:hypothetical protein GJ698_23845 [Pseudoduganella sp. FT26W]|uniref:Carboxypeptidase regulatory-like domain-containing protein n=1 Tax=Duganella aquatilis TaxID=2666082 RepID=A0A844DEB9_9BURK|nr:carboxypeptidase-like regulatory domain-containing protein [Duganella aquatilis]MRW87106.1 hypothetical protein [Duganella aquatilis]
MRKLLTAALLALTTPLMAAEATGSIAGAADAGAQIVVTNIGSGEIIGIMVRDDGTYRAEGLKPGRDRIVETGPHHAPREVGVNAGKESQVDLAARK